MKTSSRCGNSPRTLGEDGLIALAVRSFIGALDVWRKRNMPQTLQMLANAALIVRNKSERPQAKLTARKNLAFQFALAEEYSLANLHLAARPDQRLPSFGVEFARQEDFDFPCKVFQFSCSRGRVRVDAGTPPEQARRNDARVVKNEKLVASQQTGEFREEAVFEDTCQSIQTQEP